MGAPGLRQRGAEEPAVLQPALGQGRGPGPSERQWHVLLPSPSSSIHCPSLPAPGLLPCSQPLSCPKLSYPPWLQDSHYVPWCRDSKETREERPSGCEHVGGRLFSLILAHMDSRLGFLLEGRNPWLRCSVPSGMQSCWERDRGKLFLLSLAFSHQPSWFKRWF